MAEKDKSAENEREGMEVSRRGFLKTLGAGFGAVAFSVLNFNLLEKFDFLPGNHVSGNQKVREEQKIVEKEKVRTEEKEKYGIDRRLSDPENPSKGEMWLREDEM